MSMDYDALVSQASASEDAIKPLWTIKTKNDDDLLKWITTATESRRNNSRVLANMMLTNLALYKGIHWESQDAYADFRDVTGDRYQKDTLKLVINDIHRYVHHFSSKLTKYRTAVVVSPETNEFSDKQAARVGKRALDSNDQALHIKSFLTEVTRNAYTFGEQPVLVLWDKDRGPISKRWTAAKKKYGDQKTVLKDWTYKPDQPERLGDLRLEQPLPWDLLFAPASKPEDCAWVQWIYYKDIEELKIDYPKLKDKLEGYKMADAAPILDLDTLEVKPVENMVPVTWTFHRSSKYMREGLFVASIPGLVLEKGPNPYSDIEMLEESEWGDLPLERFVDWQIPGAFHGASSFTLIKNLSQTRNKLVTMMNRNIMLAGHPKALIHRGAKVNFEQMGNDMTILEWSGQVEPKIATFSTIPAEVAKFYELLGGEQDKIMRVQPVSSGTPPNGITAGVAIRLLQEMEDLLMTDRVAEQNRFVVGLARRRLAIMGKFYADNDERMVRLLGRDNRDVIETLDLDALSGRFNVRLDEASQVSETPAAKTQKVFDLLTVKPDALTKEEVIDAVELMRPEQITDPAHSVVSYAEYLCELVSQDSELPEPRPGLNYTVMWNVMMSYYQRPGYDSLPDTAKEKFETYVLGLEYLMNEHRKLSPSFDQICAANPGYPAFFALPEEDKKPPMLTPAAMGPVPGGPMGLPQELAQMPQGAPEVPGPLSPQGLPADMPKQQVAN